MKINQELNENKLSLYNLSLDALLPKNEKLSWLIFNGKDINN